MAGRVGKLPEALAGGEPVVATSIPVFALSEWIGDPGEKFSRATAGPIYLGLFWERLSHFLLSSIW